MAPAGREYAPLQPLPVNAEKASKDTQPRGDVFAGRALADEAQYFALAPREFYRRAARARLAARVFEPREHGRRDRGAQIAPPRGYRAQRAQQLAGGVGLDQVAGRARVDHRFDHVLLIVVLAQDHHLGVRRLPGPDDAPR